MLYCFKEGIAQQIFQRHKTLCIEFADNMIIKVRKQVSPEQLMNLCYDNIYYGYTCDFYYDNSCFGSVNIYLVNQWNSSASAVELWQLNFTLKKILP